MDRLVRGCPTPQPQGGTGKPETNSSAPQQEEQRDATEGKAVADHDIDIGYESERSDPDIKAVNEVEENSEAEYVKMELPQDGTLCQKTWTARL